MRVFIAMHLNIHTLMAIITEQQNMTNFRRDMMVLQAWFSPAFPTGAFSYSHGLETAIHEGLVIDALSLRSWISTLLLHGSGRNDGLFIKAAYEGDEEANALCIALCASKERSQETRELGQAFSQIVNANYQTNLPDGQAYPVAVGLAAQAIGLDLKLTLQSYLQAFSANLISVGVRSIPIGQQAGQDCLVKLYPLIEQAVANTANASLDAVGNAAILSDLVAMRHETAVPRIYRT